MKRTVRDLEQLPTQLAPMRSTTLAGVLLKMLGRGRIARRSDRRRLLDIQDICERLRTLELPVLRDASAEGVTAGAGVPKRIAACSHRHRFASPALRCGARRRCAARTGKRGDQGYPGGGTR